MKNVITASTLENYIALLIAIVKNVSQEESFKALDKAVAPRERKMLRLTDADFEDIKKLRAKKSRLERDWGNIRKYPKQYETKNIYISEKEREWELQE